MQPESPELSLGTLWSQASLILSSATVCASMDSMRHISTTNPPKKPLTTPKLVLK